MKEFKRRSIYLINPKFQIKFALLVCGLVFLSSLIYPLVIYDLLKGLLHYSSQISPNTLSFAEEKQSSLILILSAWQLSFITLIFGLLIFFTHKIAGPMYKLQNFLHTKATSKKNEKLYFRKSDYFQEIAEEVNLLFDQLEQRKFNDLESLHKMQHELAELEPLIPEDKKEIFNQVISRLEHIQKH